MNTDEQISIFLQVIRPEMGGDYLGIVMQDGEPTTQASANAPHIQGVFHWLSVELGLRPVDRLYPPGKWRPGDSPTMGLFEVRPINE